jgi:voltage-gated potassium channel
MASARRRIHDLLDFGRPQGGLGLAINGILIGLILANVAAVVLESVEALHKEHETAFHIFELISVGVFTIEYAFRLWTCVEDPTKRYRGTLRGRLRYAVSPSAIIDLLAILPTFLGAVFGADLRMLRLLRLLRVLKLTRYSAAMDLLAAVFKEDARAFGAIFAIFLVVLTLVAGAIHIVEHEAQPEAFGSIPAAMWWAVVTLTTLGYGDVVPHTIAGKVIGGTVAVLGVSVLALLAGLLSSGFNDQLRIRRRQYQLMVTAALRDGKLTEDERHTLARQRDSLGLNEADASLILNQSLVQAKPAAPLCPHCGKPLHAEQHDRAPA